MKTVRKAFWWRFDDASRNYKVKSKKGKWEQSTKKNRQIVLLMGIVPKVKELLGKKLKLCRFLGIKSVSK